MTDWQLVCLAVMAAALVVMAGVQIGLIVVGLRVAKQVSGTVEDIRRDVQPLIERARKVVDDASRASSLAVVQVERVEEMVTTAAARVDDAVVILRNAAGGPVRQAYAAFMGVRAVVSALGRRRQASERSRRDDEEALFVG